MKTEFLLSRRNFINSLSLASGSLLTPAFLMESLGKDSFKSLQAFSTSSDLTKNEAYWKKIKAFFDLDSEIINLNNGGVSPSPTTVLEAVSKYNSIANKIPSFNLYKVLNKGREPLKIRLAELAGCLPSELAINRNATEGLETVIFGLSLKAGDEVVLTKQDYPSMKNAWLQREKRDGIVLKWIDLKLPSEDREYLVSEFKNAFSEKTKIVQITHLINWNGQVLPVKEIAREAKKIGAEVILDAAHSFAQIPFKFSDFEIDYAGVSLHKWLSAPFGTGLLFVAKNKIKTLYPLFAAPENDIDKIEKFEHLGTRSFAIEQAINEAIDFHLQIGTELKFERLSYLKNYWIKKLSKIEGVEIFTPRSKEFSAGIALFHLEGYENRELLNLLYKKYKIHATMINLGNLVGIRISPNVYTLKKDLDKLVSAIKELSHT